MYLSTHQSRALTKVMRLLAEATDGDLLREALAQPMLDLLASDQYVSMVWNAPSDRFERCTSLNLDPASLRAWDAYYRHVDPLTFPMMERRQPTVATQILSQANLSKTEFFNDFLMRERMHWGINVYFFEREECVGDFRIWRRRERGNFTADEAQLLRMIEPAIAAALGRLRKGAAPIAIAPAAESAEDVLQRALGLSRREAEVAWRVACGGSDKQIAQRLQVEYATVRFHLANAFRKLQADNRAALAARVQRVVDGQGGPLGLH